MASQVPAPQSLPPVSTKSVFLLAFPAALSVLLNNGFRIIDQFAVQWLGMEAQAAIGSVTFVLIAYFGLYALISAGTLPMVARATGAGDALWRRQIIGSAITGAVFLGLIVNSLSWLFAPQIARGLGLTGQPAALAATYLSWLAICCLPLVLAPVVDSIFVGLGQTKQMMFLRL